jgi:hypothetical protein
MARTNIPVTNLAAEAGTLLPAATTIVQASGAEINAGGDAARLVIWVKQTDATARVLTVVAPTDNLHAPRAPLGSVTVTCAQNAEYEILVESARHAQTDGKIHIDFAAEFAGTIRARRLPRGT